MTEEIQNKPKIGIRYYTEKKQLEEKAERRGKSLDRIKLEEKLMLKTLCRAGVLLALENFIQYEVTEDENGRIDVTGYIVLPTSQEEVDAMKEKLSKRNLVCKMAFADEEGFKEVGAGRWIGELDRKVQEIATRIWAKEFVAEKSKSNDLIDEFEKPKE